MKRLRRLIVVLPLCLTAIAGTSRAAENLPSVESFFKAPDVHFAELSPGGNYVATLATVDGYEVLGVRDTIDLKKLTIASASNDNKILSARWVDENRLVFVLKNTHLIYQEGNTDTYAVNRDGSNLVQLISGSWDHHQQNTGSNIVDRTLTADYALQGVTHDGSGDIIVRKYVFNRIDRTSYSFHLYRLNTKTKKLSEMMEGKQPGNVYKWVLDANDVPRFALSLINGKCITSYYSIATATWSEMTNLDCHDQQRLDPVTFESDTSLFVKASSQGFEALYRYDLNSGKLASEPFLSVKGFDFDGVPEVDRVSKKVLGFHFNSDARSTAWLEPKFNELQKKVDGILTQTVNTITCGSDCLHTPALLIMSSSDRQPVQYAIYTLADGKIIGLGGAHPEIKPAQMGMRDFYHFAARDGLSIPVYVTLPPGKIAPGAATARPAVVLVHGGPYLRGASWEWNADAQFLASRGYVVIQPEFRGSTGFGFAHYQAGWKQWGLAMQDDLADAAKWAIQKGWADPERICIMGASYGGYATLMGLIKNPELFRCGVEWAGVTDINMMFSLSENDATQEQLNYGMRTVIGDPVTDASQFSENSPLNHADKLTQPLLMAHGGLDARVPIAQASAFHNAVSRNNSRVEWIVYKDEGHGWVNPENNIDFWRHVEAFLNQNLKHGDK